MIDFLLRQTGQELDLGEGARLKVVSANPPGLVAHLRPQVVLLSVAAGDRRGLPDEEVLEAVEGYSLLRTDQNGWIELSADGEQMWVEVERE